MQLSAVPCGTIVLLSIVRGAQHALLEPSMRCERRTATGGRRKGLDALALWPWLGRPRRLPVASELLMDGFERLSIWVVATADVECGERVVELHCRGEHRDARAADGGVVQVERL